ncbi:MAG: phosphomethylpyrimidine synthase ThiC, partial [Candidatus Brocadiia bacterium]
MTQLQMANASKITAQMEAVAKIESVAPSYIRDKIKEGHIVLLSNNLRWTGKSNIPQRIICGVGEGLRTKVNANIGTSSHGIDEKAEIKKLKASEESGADTVMDLSTGGDLKKIRESVIRSSRIPVGTVPVYEAVVRRASNKDRKDLLGKMTADDIFDAVEAHLKSGVDFITVHCGVTRDVVKDLSEDGRVGGMVSRGGTMLTEWMRLHQSENPLYAEFDRLLDLTKAYDATLSLGDGLRPGALADAFDRAQVHELMVLAGLARRARAAGVQVMIEGPGHVPLDQIQAQVKLQKELCDGAPFYVLGPLVVDNAPGYDHITSAIGAALAGWAGADFICYVTP